MCLTTFKSTTLPPYLQCGLWMGSQYSIQLGCEIFLRDKSENGLHQWVTIAMIASEGQIIRNIDHSLHQ